ncbi:hypothetical protein J437_LFUL016162 [Ladona fulva]|uniref:Mutator-like transposase domain-containing protein n=1 Tax=Ladona fulva TaxID=123851 RepID=A0A8K0P7A0_LADFU|nr:hypothetical protein J437_LFUL016162 [Ladona fulva]
MSGHKGSHEQHRTGEFRKDVRRRKFPPKNPHTAEQDIASTSTAAKKFHDVPVPEEEMIGYRLLNFLKVFSAISEFVKCKKCGGRINFKAGGTRGLGFKIMVICKNCDPIYIPLYPLISSGFEINRRFFFALRLLGIGLGGAKKFCGIIDLPPPVAQKSYDAIIKNIHLACLTVSTFVFKKAVMEEREVLRKGLNKTEFTVSGDGSWKKTWISFPHRIGFFNWVAHMKKYDSKCTANHTGSAWKIEVNAIVEMFSRSEERYGITYVNYIGDGDSKTYKGVLDVKPYGDGFAINKRKCIGHVQKRMGMHLRQCVKKNKGVGGRNKLSGKMIDKLTIYYGLAIRRNRMSDASNDEEPIHGKCPPGHDSWCSWRKAEAEVNLTTYRHDYKSLPDDVLWVMKPIYTELTVEALLQRCLGGCTQNNNESLHSLIWNFSPKEIHSGVVVAEIAANIASCIFNEGNVTLLKVMQVMGVKCGNNVHSWAVLEDAGRLSRAEYTAMSSTREGRAARKGRKMEEVEGSTSKEGKFYSPGIDDVLLRSPVKSPAVQRILRRAEEALVRERIQHTIRALDVNARNLFRLHLRLASLMSPRDWERVDRATMAQEEVQWKKTTDRQTKKYKHLAETKPCQQKLNPDRVVINLTSDDIDEATTSILMKGLNFAPAPTTIPYQDFIGSDEQAIRSLSTETVEEVRGRIGMVLEKARPPKPNLSREERQAISRLRNNKDVVVLPADKGLPEEDIKRLRPQAPFPPRLYGLPKVHKVGVPLRPLSFKTIVSSISSPTYPLAKYLAGLLSPHVASYAASYFSDAMSNNFPKQPFDDAILTAFNLIRTSPSTDPPLTTNHQEIIEILLSLKINKAPGPDAFSNKILELLAHSTHFIKLITNLFNACLQNHYFPESWKLGTIASHLNEQIS